MLRRGLRRPLHVIGPIIFLIYTGFRFHSNGLGILPFHLSDHVLDASRHSIHSNVNETHLELFSVSTADKKYFLIDFGDQPAMNPSIVPHPTLNDTWIIVAQQIEKAVPNSVWHAELVCNANFKNGRLGCMKSPVILPIAATFGGKCEGDLAYIDANIGPHDARVFHGPKAPFTIYGSNSAYTCFGQWMQDFRVLVDWGLEILDERAFGKATELQRPGPYRSVEKNWFAFWDIHGEMYVHHDIVPERAFAKLEYDGSVGHNLASQAAISDLKCMEKCMPKASRELESIHQATNSLSITLCKQSDPTCAVDASNTFILAIFQHKSYFAFHSVYEPYLMLFRQTEPFEIYGVSRKPFWVHGRGKPFEEKSSPRVTRVSKPLNHSEMFYITSMSWKKQGQRYHGYTDDVLFLAFGIEDSAAGGIDILAGDLITDLCLCSEGTRPL